MSERPFVTLDEARSDLAFYEKFDTLTQLQDGISRYAYTVATEPERIRVARMESYNQGYVAGYERVAETEPDRTRAAVVEALLPIRRYAEASAMTARALGNGEDERKWLDVLVLVERGENGVPL